MIVDTSALLAYVNGRELSHDAVAALFESAQEPLIVSPFVLAELDYFLLTRSGVRSELAVLRSLLGPAWDLAKVTDAHLEQAVEIIDRYEDEKIGLADAVNVVLADINHTTRIATLDHRHFSVLKLPGGKALDILP